MVPSSCQHPNYIEKGRESTYFLKKDRLCRHNMRQSITICITNILKHHKIIATPAICGKSTDTHSQAWKQRFNHVVLMMYDSPSEEDISSINMNITDQGHNSSILIGQCVSKKIYLLPQA